jgi:L-ascorbate metabolism protein UlaG (beta-lactamase superfamily)
MTAITYIGGPTVLIEIEGLRLLTDPTFDAAGGEYATSAYSLHKTQGPAVAREALGRIDAVLLSHDHHFDNLDTSGRALLEEVEVVLTTQAGAQRLGGAALGLEPWQTHELVGADGRRLAITATPARHGPEGGDRGPVVGFVLHRPGDRHHAVYLSGDTVWYPGVQEVANAFAVDVALLFMGAARVAAAGPSPLTFTADEGVEAARVFANASIVPVHYEGWAHFSENRREIDAAFGTAGLRDRLRWLEPGKAENFAAGAPLPSAVV